VTTNVTAPNIAQLTKKSLPLSYEQLGMTHILQQLQQYNLKTYEHLAPVLSTLS